MQASYVEVRNVLKNIHFPLMKQNLIQQAIKHGASRVVMKTLRIFQIGNIPVLAVSSRNLVANNSVE